VPTTAGEDAGQLLLLSVEQAAELCGLSRAMMYKQLAAGRIGPEPIRFGKAVRFSAEELRTWAAAGAPPRHEWASIRAAATRREGAA
jgi:excisionase family DNA binding protein